MTTNHALSRRAFLAATAGAVVLAACGDESDPSTAASSTTSGTTGTSTSTDDSKFVLVSFVATDVLRAGSPSRVPIAIATRDGAFIDDPPDELAVSVVFDDKPIGPEIVVPRHAEGIPRPYFPLVFTPPQPGVYTLVSAVDGEPAGRSVQVNDPSAVRVLSPGTALPAIITPTVADNAGVNPICTAEPQCPLHDLTLKDAVATGKPVAALISTPKFCQISICGPVLDVLLAARQDFPDIQYVHLEVYTDETVKTTAPAVATFGLSYEPALFLAKAGGAIDDRLDNIFDAVELRDSLSRLVS